MHALKKLYFNPKGDCSFSRPFDEGKGREGGRGIMEKGLSFIKMNLVCTLCKIILKMFFTA